MISERVSRLAFPGIVALLFVCSATVTVAWCMSMSDMGTVPMPGGWSLSMAWMPMCGQTWTGAAATFTGMWLVMMVAMMLPALVPMLRRYRRAVGRTAEGHRGQLTILVGVGYFFIWGMAGGVVFPLGAGLADMLMRFPALAQAGPLASGLVVLGAGVQQFSGWKLRQLACCRQTDWVSGSAGAAWRHGLRLGLRCVRCCAGPTAVLLVLGAMDPWVMVIVAGAISLERLAPNGERFARATGTVAVAAGAFLVAQAVAQGF